MADIINMKEWLSKITNGTAETVPLLERLESTRLRMIADLESMIAHYEMISEYCESDTVTDAIGKLIGFRDIMTSDVATSMEAARIYTGIALAMEKIGNDVSQAIRSQLDTLLNNGDPA